MTSLQGLNDATSSGDDQVSLSREELQEALCRYVADTLIYIDTVRGFCEKMDKWALGRETELNMMTDIKDRVDSIDLNIGHVSRSENKAKAFSEYMKSRMTQVTADSRLAKLQKELAALLKDTLGGLEKLDCFLDAVEKLAVTSLHVFPENQVLHLPEGINLEQVEVVISAARLICPLLLEFKRDAQVFFLPKLQIVKVLSYQLAKYIQTTQTICGKFVNRSLGNVCQIKPAVDIHVNLSEDDMQRMHHHISELFQIRMDPDFRTVFIFQKVPCSRFISEFNERQPRMLEFLKDLEKRAVKLDRMSKGAKISRVAGSSVGAVGSVLSIVGLALTPVTAGVSLGLTMAGLGLGIAHGLNSAVTTGAEIGVKHKHQKKAEEVFKSFMKDVQSLQDCLKEVTSQPVTEIEASKLDVALGVSRVLTNIGGIGKNIENIVEGAAVCDVPQVAAEIGEAAANAGLITVSALFLGIDILSICKNGFSLAKGAKSETSHSIRAAADLWRSEMNSWEKIYKSLHQGLQTSEKNKAILDRPFYPEKVTKEERDTESTSNYMEDTEQVHVEDQQKHEEDKQKHEEDKQKHEEDKQKHEEDKEKHVEDKQKHEEDKQKHEEDKQKHEEDKQKHEEDKQKHVEDKQKHEEDKQKHEEDKQKHEEDKQKHEEDKQANVEDKQKHEDDKQAHVEDKQIHEENKQAHVEDKLIHVEDKHAHVEDEDKQKHEEDKQEPAPVKDKGHVHHKRWIMKLCTVFINLLNPAGPCGGPIITSYRL